MLSHNFHFLDDKINISVCRMVRPIPECSTVLVETFAVRFVLCDPDYMEEQTCC